jgi:hypothetical protein
LCAALRALRSAEIEMVAEDAAAPRLHARLELAGCGTGPR